MSRTKSLGSHPALAWREFLFVLALGLALIFAIAYVTVNLMLPEAADPDEGVYLIVARLLNAGYGYNTFYFDQFWLFPQILAAGFRAFGDSLETGRLVVVAFSAGGLLALALLARQLSAKWAAPLVILFGVINHYYLAQSRYAMTDVPGVALMLWALVAMLRFTLRKNRRWLALSGAFCAASLLVKPLAIGFAVPLGIWLVAARIERVSGRYRLALRALALDAAAFAMGGVLLAAPFVDLFDLGGEFQRTVGFHWDEKDWYAPQLALRHLALVSFFSENRMWLALASLGALSSGWRKPLLVVPLILAEILSVLILLQLPPWWHHYALLAPLLSLFAALGVYNGIDATVQIFRLWSRPPPMRHRQFLLRAAIGAAFLCGSAVWLHDAPQLARYNLAVLNESAHDATPLVRYLKKNFAPGTFLLSDNPIVLYLAGMLLPPPAVNLPYESTFRFSKLSQEKLKRA